MRAEWRVKRAIVASGTASVILRLRVSSGGRVVYTGEVKAHRHSSADSDRTHSRRTGQVGYARAGPRRDHNHCLDRYSGSIRRRFLSPEPLRGPRYDADKPPVNSHSDPWRDNPAGDLPADNTPGGIAKATQRGPGTSKKGAT